ncbi:MAG: DHA2 family efflux MFS transporter permease subunit [Alphaproteobacteria bacterium]|nr:DHA2 family efflux MFS transporter permease subunit [Alphaproteobacteria bacterium]
MSASGAVARSGPAPLQGFVLWAGIATLAMANFMAVLDMTIVNVSVPHIAGSMAVSVNEGTWAITSYSVAEAIMVPLTGWLAQRFGPVRVFSTAALLFGACSMLCGLSTSLPMLVTVRVLQGLAGGPLMPMSQTLLLRIAPPEKRNMALGLWTMTTILGPIAGPVLGGLFSDTLGWPWAFYINVPIAIICTTLVLRTLSQFETPTVKKPIDYVGLALLVIWVGALQIMLDNGENDDWFASNFIVTLAIVALVGFISFLAWELTDEHPIVDLRIFRYRSFALSAVALLFTFGSFMGSIVLIPLWLQTSMGYTATTAGQMMAFNGIVALFLAPIVANMIGKVDPRFLMSLGLGLVALDTFWRTTFNTDISFWGLVPAQMALGLGMPLFFLPMMSMSMGAVKPEETASAAGLINFLRTMAGAFATGVIVFAWRDSTAASHVEIAGSLNNAPKVLAQMQAVGQGHQQALMSLDGIVQTQAVMLGTNQVFGVVAIILACVSAGVWLMPKPKLAPMKMGGGH